MTKETLVEEIRRCLAEGTPAEQEARRKEEEKRKFVSQVMDFVQTPEIVDLLRRLPDNGRNRIGLLDIEHHYGGRFSYESEVSVTVYKAYIERLQIVVETRSNRDTRHYSFPAKLDEWMRILPYGTRFSGCEEFKPEIGRYLTGVERQIKYILEETWRR
ncbi:hypothetical protein HZB90_00155 [archaeon]|nr:hypothetical protein [archaeon]